MQRPYQRIVQVLCSLQHILIEKSQSVQTHGSQIRIQHRPFDDVEVFGQRIDLEHPVSPHHEPHSGAGLVVCSDIGQLVGIAIGLMDELM